MISVEEAEGIIQKHWPNFGEDYLTVESTEGGTLHQPLLGDRDYPPDNRVMMDGIAVSFETYLSGLREFKVEGVCAAGSPIQTLRDQKNCIEIMTGAVLPENTDLIIPYEHIKIENKIATLIQEQKRERFENIHPRASDFKKGDTILKSGFALNGPRWGIAASLGIERVRIQKKPKITIISTGDELISVGSEPLPHQVRRSNAYALKASLLSRGYNGIRLDHVKDEYESLLTHYEESANQNEVLIYSGGVSKGKFDYLPKVWDTMGVTKHFHEVSQRPGKPLWFGVDSKRKVAVIGLPGNPISSLVCLHRYFLNEPVKYARLTDDVHFEKKLSYFVPAQFHHSDDSVTHAKPLEVKSSGEFSGLAQSDGFIELPASLSHFKKGESYRIFEWGNR
jgi:molybdopterin molybdotransferase